MSTRKLGKYVMLETLGQGGFSKVRLGLDESTGERVALKCLKKKEMGITADVIKQVEREIHAMQKIVHQNVIRLKDVDWNCEYTKKNGTKIQIILVVLELATGGELFDFLAFTGPFEEAIARTYFQQLIAGIAHCHEKGIAHRDLKPENILLDSQFVLKLADFGFASSFNSVQNVMYTECGTPGYMAPEVFASSSANGRKGYEGAMADIWSCGVVLFIQLAGFPPFQRPAMNDWWFNKLSNNKHHLFWEAHQRTAYFSDLVKDFLNKILCPDVTKRMKMSELQNHPWFKGPTISHSALFAELQRRKHTVDENKIREKAEKASKIAGSDGSAVPAQAGLLERGDVSMTRGEGPVSIIDFASESLPLAVPSITAFGKNAPAARVGDGYNAESSNALAAPRGATMSADAFASSEGGEAYEGGEGEWAESSFSAAKEKPATDAATSANAASSSSSSTVVEAPLFSAVNQSFTRFAVSKFSDPRDLYRTLQESLTGLGCTLTSNDAKFKIKRAKCVTSQGIIEFSVSVTRDPNSSDLIVDFKRLSQDSAQFRVLYAEIRYKLRDIISEQPNETLRATTQPLAQ